MAAEAAAASALGMTLFTYNQGNYLFDAAFRFERFSTGRDFACQQMDQYRQDIRALTAFTQKKTTMYAVLASLCMGICVALYVPGRLGMTGPATPGWILGLWVTNNAAAFSFMILAVWLAIHASFRSNAASVHLLTRKARAPVPTLRQLDRARRFSSEFEQQKWGDILRVPYLCRSGAPRPAEFEGGAAGQARSASPRKNGPASASSWVRDEFETDRGGIQPDVAPDQVELPADVAPEHFRLYAAVQKEWYAYEVYSRICLLYGFLSFIHALAYFGLGYILMEARALWAGWACVFVLMALQALLIKFDVVERLNSEKERFPHCQWLGPLAVFPAAMAMCIDFKVGFSMMGVVFTWIFVLSTYAMQLVYTLRLLELMQPDEPGASQHLEERLGTPWWPEQWRVPSTFRHVLYLLAPPTRLQPGQHDLVREVKEGAGWGPADPAAAAAAVSAAAAANPESGAKQQPLSQEEVAEQVQYVDKLFEWAFSDEVFTHLSQTTQQKIRELYHSYSATRSKGITPELSGALEEVVTVLGATIEAEGLPPLAGGGDLSGCESPGGRSSGGDSSGGEGDGSPDNFDKRRTHSPAPPFAQTRHIYPSRLVSLLVMGLCVAWCVGIFGVFVDMTMGEQGLMTARSRPPMTRLPLQPFEVATPMGFPWPAGSKPLIPEQMAWDEQKAGRKLQPATGRPRGSDLSDAVRSLLDTFPTADTVGRSVPAWSGFFEPQLLACGPADTEGGGIVAALAPRGFGAAARVGAAPNVAAASLGSFRLAGLGELPPLVGASWGAPGEGLLVVSRAGHLRECLGHRPPDGGTWPCRVPTSVPDMLPVAPGGKLLAAAAAWLGGRLHAAFIDAGAPEVVAVFVAELADEVLSWVPQSEVAVPNSRESAVPRISLGFHHSGDLFLSTNSGAVVRRRLQDGAVVGSSVDAARSEGHAGWSRSWRSTCVLQHPHSGLAHLHLSQAPGSTHFRTELEITADDAAQADVLQ